MSIQEFSAERKFWATPELVRTLLPFLDTSSTKQLAESHKLTRWILENSFNWNKLIKRTFPHGQGFGREKVGCLAKILSLSKASSSRSLLELDLLHAICENFSHEPDTRFQANFATVSCSCLQTHQVYHLGFLLMEDVAAILDSRAQGVLEVGSSTLSEPLLTSLGSMALRQQEMVRSLRSVFVDNSCFYNRRSAEAFANLMESTRRVTLGLPGGFPKIHVDKPIESEVWSAIRRAIEVLSRKHRHQVSVVSARCAMAAGKREDMKAIWEAIQNWEVRSDEGSTSYKMCFSNVKGQRHNGWEDWEGVFGTRKGLGSVINMSQEEWLETNRQAIADDVEESKNAWMFEGTGEFSPEEMRETIRSYEETGRFSLEERMGAGPWLYLDHFRS